MKIPPADWLRPACLTFALVLPLFFGACTSTGPHDSGAQSVAQASSFRYVEAEDGAATGTRSGGAAISRPGLATGVGHERWSQAMDTTFFRKNSSPDALAKFHYNDEAGAKAMAELHGKCGKKSGWMDVAGDRVKVALVPLYGSFPYPRYEAGGESIVIAESGDTYAIHLKNLTNRRLEMVVSVDGLNVLNGQPAGTTQRGYILEPKQDLKIEGFRKNKNRVETFRFGAVGDSVAAAKGTPRNVGVVGLAVFEEDVVRAKEVIRQEQNKRLDSDAFPVSQR